MDLFEDFLIFLTIVSIGILLFYIIYWLIFYGKPTINKFKVKINSRWYCKTFNNNIIRRKHPWDTNADYLIIKDIKNGYVKTYVYSCSDLFKKEYILTISELLKNFKEDKSNVYKRGKKFL